MISGRAAKNMVNKRKRSRKFQTIITKEILNVPKKRRRRFFETCLLLFFKHLCQWAAEGIWVADSWNHQAGLLQPGGIMFNRIAEENRSSKVCTSGTAPKPKSIGVYSVGD